MQDRIIESNSRDQEKERQEAQQRHEKLIHELRRIVRALNELTRAVKHIR